MISKIRAGSWPTFQNRVPLVARLEDEIAGAASHRLIPEERTHAPLQDIGVPVSRECRCKGAASAREDIGCSTSEKLPLVSCPSIMKRTPMLPKKPVLPSLGPVTFAIVVAMSIRGLSLNAALADSLRHPPGFLLDRSG
jgi:hypothetical protein